MKDPRHTATKVEIPFSESPDLKPGCVPAMQNMREANVVFRWENYKAEQKRTDGKLLGYYKTDFVITFSDGTQYQGRFDLGSDESDLTRHVRRFCEVYSGRMKPPHMTPEHWEAFKSHYTEEQLAYHGNILDNYNLEA